MKKSGGMAALFLGFQRGKCGGDVDVFIYEVWWPAATQLEQNPLV
jgi:hypothetical protein